MMPLKDLYEIFEKDTFVIIHINYYDVDFIRKLSFEYIAAHEELFRMYVKKAMVFDGMLHFYLQEEPQ